MDANRFIQGREGSIIKGGFLCIVNFLKILERSIGFLRMLCGTVLYCVHCTVEAGNYIQYSKVHTYFH